MGRMWICEGCLAKKGLAVTNRVSLYSLEELCYYLYHNAESVEESIYNEAFCQWIADELCLDELANELREGLEQGKSGGWCMEQILLSGGIYSHREINQAVSIVQSMESTSPAQRAKLKGDRLQRSGKYRQAWIAYQEALEEESDLLFKGKVWHNLGTLYARQFLFEEAGACYKRAYELGQQTVSSEAYLFVLTCRDGQAKGQDSGNASVQAAGSANGPVAAQNLGHIAGAIKELRKMKESGDRMGYEGMVEDLLFKLRLEYRKSE